MILAFLTVFLPAVGALVAGLGGPLVGARGAQRITSGILIFTALCATLVFVNTLGAHGKTETFRLFTWFASGDFQFGWDIRVDMLSSIMFVVVTYVSAVVHIYSIGYMQDDKGVQRFHSYLSLFTFAMLMLVSADNLVQLFFGWEGVGVCSYLLIGYYHHKASANKAAMKAFIVNRVGDVGFALGIFGLFAATGSVGFDTIFASLADLDGKTLLGLPLYDTLGILLFIGAMGKSAQLGLHTWLPDAMEGPTPVSALIHAATMVTAGVFLVCRMSPLMELAPIASAMITYVGAATALFAATVGLTQFDIKRVIAYSTCSQLGYMFFAAGVGAYNAAMFHLMTHAFFKALLFLSAGSVIHALRHEQDMRKMGGIWRKIPVTYAYMWIGSLALAGVGYGNIGFAGFFSKDAILESAYAAHSMAGGFAFWVGIVVAFLTAFYSWRLLFLTFHGTYRGDKHSYDYAHESPKVMLIPMAFLALGALVSGMGAYDWFFGHHPSHFFGAALTAGIDKITDAAHHVPTWVKMLPLAVGLLGIVFAYLVYGRGGNGEKIVQRFTAIHRFFYNKWYFDTLYDFLFVKPAMAIGRFLWRIGDEAVIDGLGPNGVAKLIARGAKRASAMQTGFVFHYAFVMFLGLVIFISWLLIFAR